MYVCLGGQAPQRQGSAAHRASPEATVVLTDADKGFLPSGFLKHF